MKTSLWMLTALVGTVTPAPTVSNPVNPCMAVANAAANRVPAKMAYDCLNDMPLDQMAARPWLDTLRPYLEWQTTTSYLKNPPASYLEPSIDIWSEFQNIYQKATIGGFANEYDFEFTLYRLFQRAHDGHFRYLPNAVGGVFLFGRPLSLVSYSEDGVSLPRPYVYSDVLSHFVNGTAPPSPITTIDGQDAITFLEDWAQYGSLQDPDALYNNVFFGLAQAALGTTGSGAGTFAGGGRGAYIYPGPTTTLTFANGTTNVYENFARVLFSFDGIENGTTLYKRFVNPIPNPTPSTNNGASAAVNPAPIGYTPRPGYPDPVQLQQSNYVAGYYLNQTGYSDVAVLAVTSFVGESDYQAVAYNFIEGAVRDGKTKLMIDVSANGGGTIMQGYNLFLNLFPGTIPYGATRFRAHEAFNLIGETASQRIPYYPYNYTFPPNYIWQDFAGGTPFNYRADVDINGKSFDSWPDKYGPHEFNHDNFTSIVRWNLSDPTIQPANRLQINGYGNRTGLPPKRPFAPENVVILYDGYCASTCSIFSEFMTTQIGIKTIAIGGRPQGRTMMQAVGGVKGANNYPWVFINQLVDDAYNLAPDQASYFNTTVLSQYRGETALIPFARGVTSSGEINVRDAIRQGDTTQTPLQFVYEAANCRLFYTAEMTVDVTAMWEKVADVTWGNGNCVVGSVRSAQAKRDNDGKATDTEKLKKRTTTVSLDKARELQAAQDLWTDLSAIKQIGRGFMAP